MGGRVSIEKIIAFILQGISLASSGAQGAQLIFNLVAELKSLHGISDQQLVDAATARSALARKRAEAFLARLKAAK